MVILSEELLSAASCMYYGDYKCVEHLKPLYPNDFRMYRRTQILYLQSHQNKAVISKQKSFISAVPMISFSPHSDFVF